MYIYICIISNFKRIAERVERIFWAAERKNKSDSVFTPVVFVVVDVGITGAL